MIVTGSLSDYYRPGDSSNIIYIDSPRVDCMVRLSGAHTATTVQANWVYEKSESQEAIYKVIYADNKTQGQDGYLGFTLNAPSQGFNIGQYRLDLSIAGGQQISIPFFVKRDPSGPTPNINHFSSEPEQIVSGETSKLSWSVSDASRVSIEPSPGAVAPEGSMDITPTADTTYTLWAINRGGSTSNQISITVQQPVKDRANLVVTDFWSSGNVLSYRIKNIGNLTSCATETYLYRDDTLEAKSYVEPLSPGNEEAKAFLTYHFSPRFPSLLSSSSNSASSGATNIRVCANGDGSCLEADYTNNCLEHNFGPLMNVNLLQYSANAQWQSSAGLLSWPMFASVEHGWAQISTAQIKSGLSYPNALLMTPPASSGSWIQGAFGVPIGSPAELRPFTVPHGCKFSANVGLTADAPEDSNVKFTFGTSQGGTVKYFPPVTVNSGQLATYTVDLSGLAGQKVLFILRVESGSPLPQGSAVWIEPVLSQQR